VAFAYLLADKCAELPITEHVVECTVYLYHFK